MTDTVVVKVKPGSRKGPLVEVGSTGELTIYVREPAVAGKAKRHGHPATGSPPSIAEKPSRIGIWGNVAAETFPGRPLSAHRLWDAGAEGKPSDDHVD